MRTIQVDSFKVWPSFVKPGDMAIAVYPRKGPPFLIRRDFAQYFAASNTAEFWNGRDGRKVTISLAR